MGRKILIALLVNCLLWELVSAATDKVVCYHGSWSKYRSGNGQFTVNDIDPNLCTHLIYSFVGINTDGSILLLDSTLDVNNANFANFNALKTRNAALKTLVAVGGWGEGSTKYSAVAASATSRATFIQSALNLVQTYGFDGFDIDWEYPAQRGGAAADVQNYATLIKEFRTVFDKHGLLLTAAVAATPGSVDQSYDVPALSKYLDIINVMAYDIHASWDGVTGQNAPLYASSIDTTASAKLLNVNASISGWISRGADPQKLALGLGVYGRSFTLSNSAISGLGAPVSGAGNSGPYTLEAGMLGYNEICEAQLAGGWTTVWDDEQKVPYSFKGDQWIGYDNPRSIAIKASIILFIVNYAKSLNLGGVMIWSIETEDFRGICGSKYPILNAIKSALGTANENIEENVNDDTGGNDDASSGGGTAVDDGNDTPVGDETVVDDGTASGGTGGVTCTQAGYIRDPADCNKFYYCLLVGSSYQPLAQQCNSNLYFDLESQTCNWPQLVSGC
ncbi:hypothetical protein NQ315_007161 [Exocentrus adspersus]|uniref:chitinase n=1 Tax=Exocentrus adspersus TaxID=1586481 RepID=A0AAV8WE73_9CUCU|nr:hypothetical protein NQ315_007161 [Exocentrus adspersus]